MVRFSHRPPRPALRAHRGSGGGYGGGGGGGGGGKGLVRLASTAIVALASFYAGAIVGMRMGKCPSSTSDGGTRGGGSANDGVGGGGGGRAETLARRRGMRDASAQRSGRTTGLLDQRFGPHTSKFAWGAARTTKRDLLDLYDNGFPRANAEDPGSTEALIFYSGERSLPSDRGRANAARHDDGNGLPMLSAADATANCDALNIVTTQAAGGLRQCLAIVGHYESYHVQRWMRTDGKNKVDKSLPLVKAGRGQQSNGVNQFRAPKSNIIEKHWAMLRNFLNTVDEVTARLKPVAAKVAKENAIVVVVCNLGQSVLLMNFYCSAKAKGFDVDNVLVFATDRETRDLAEGLGMTAFYEEKNFKNLPSQEAASYGDKTFMAMMYAKVVAVQLVSMLGYDILFQDVDVVWYKDPVAIFREKGGPYEDYDALFQHDGAMSVRYAPYCANSGFYYVRNNERTRYLFTSLLYSGDLILSSHSHQQALAALLAEHSSLFGLKVKTLDGEDFPGGYHYHRKREMMREIVDGKRTPWIFHMSWTKNKDNKLLFFKQMGLWYLNERCEKEDKALKVLDKSRKKGAPKFRSTCCASEPLVSCHYRDKPSVIPCRDSPAIDKAGRPFWP